MRVALYYPWVYLTGGAERLILEVTGRSRHEWTIITNHFDPESTFPELRDRHVVNLAPVSVERNLASVASAGWRILWQKMPLEECDALLVVCEGLGDLAVFRNGRLPILCYCLTPLRMAFDEEYQRRYLDRASFLGRLLLRSCGGFFRFVDRLAWRRYDQAFFISREVANRAVTGGLIQSKQVEILPPASGIANDVASDVFEPYFLLPGRIMWTKNLELGIEAFHRMIEQHPQLRHFRLIVAGMVDKKSQNYLAELRKLAGTRGDVEFRETPRDAELARLYANCHGVLFTPFNEDYGIVPLEGMSFGKPVVAVNRGGPKETISDGVDGFLVESTKEAFAQAMATLALDPETARRMGRQGFKKSRLVSWDRCVERIDDSVDRLVGAASPVFRPNAPLPAHSTAATDSGP